MVEDAIQQGLMFDMPEKHWKALKKCDRILATWEKRSAILLMT